MDMIRMEKKIDAQNQEIKVLKEENAKLSTNFAHLRAEKKAMNLEVAGIINDKNKEIRTLKNAHCTVCGKGVGKTIFQESRKEHGLPRVCPQCA